MYHQRYNPNLHLSQLNQNQQNTRSPVERSLDRRLVLPESRQLVHPQGLPKGYEPPVVIQPYREIESLLQIEQLLNPR